MFSHEIPLFLQRGKSRACYRFVSFLRGYLFGCAGATGLHLAAFFGWSHCAVVRGPRGVGEFGVVCKGRHGLACRRGAVGGKRGAWGGTIGSCCLCEMRNDWVDGHESDTLISNSIFTKLRCTTTSSACVELRLNQGLSGIL